MFVEIFALQHSYVEIFTAENNHNFASFGYVLLKKLFDWFSTLNRGLDNQSFKVCDLWLWFMIILRSSSSNWKWQNIHSSELSIHFILYYMTMSYNEYLKYFHVPETLEQNFILLFSSMYHWGFATMHSLTLGMLQINMLSKIREIHVVAAPSVFLRFLI